MRHQRTAWAGLALGLMVLAGCGDDDAGDAQATTSTTSTTTASTASTSTTASDDAGSGEAFTGADSEAFCSVARSAPLDALQGAGQGADLEAAFDEVLSSFEQLEEVAPEEIDDDITVVRQAWADLREPLAAADWNPLAVDPAALSGRVEQNEAADRLDAYLLEVCDLEPAGERG